MTKKTETFTSLMHSFQPRYELRSVFEDFLTMAVCAFGQNPITKKSYDEDLYLQTIGKYKDDKNSIDTFPKLLVCLTNEMEERVGSDSGNDVLGEFYEENLYRKGAQQYFTPWHICKLMSAMTITGKDASEPRRPLRILDPCCGSGRMLLAGAGASGKQNSFYGIDIDLVCVKMTAINLFLNGLFHSEVMCANALDPDDFRVSYKISLLPFGIFRVEVKEDSLLWNMNRNSFNSRVQTTELILPSEEMGRSQNTTSISQLKIF